MIKRITKRAMTCRFIALIGIVFISSVDSVYSAEVNKLMASIGIAPLQGKQIAPDFTLKNLNGKEVNLSDYRGKLVLLNFMDTGCHWCQKEMPHLQKLYDEFKDKDFVIVVVFTDRQAAATVVPFIEKNGYTFSIGSGMLDLTGEVSIMYGVTGTPTTYLIDHEGNIIGLGIGYRDWSGTKARDLIEELLKSG